MPADPSPHAVPATILALSTSGPWCSVALLRDEGATLDVHDEHVGHGHARRALPMIDALLAATGGTLADVRGVAFDAGPGGFTGLRIACALAQGLGFGLGVPLAAIGSLEALALGALDDVGAGHAGATVLALTDARMGECYVAAFAGVAAGGLWSLETLEAARICPLAAVGPWIVALAARRDGHPLIVAGEACARFPAVAEAARVAGALASPGSRPAAGAVARLAGSAMGQVRWSDAAQARPFYVRDKVALDIGEQRELRRRNAAERA